MGEFFLVIIVLVAMVAVAGVVILGEITPLYSTMSEALYTLCLLILVGDDGGAYVSLALSFGVPVPSAHARDIVLMGFAMAR